MEEKRKYKVTLKGNTKEYPQGTSFEAIADDFKHLYKDRIVLGIEGFKLFELRNTLKHDCDIDFITTSDPVGNQTYRRSMCFMMVKAVHDVCGHDTSCGVRIEFSISKGYYCTLRGREVTPGFLSAVRARMLEMVSSKMPIKKRSVHTDDAIAIFRKHGMSDKERLFHYRSVSRVNLYSMNEFEDYYYGYMVPDASYLPYFELYPYAQGFVLQMPEAMAPDAVPPFKPQEKIFHVLDEATKWGDMQGIETVADLNEIITKGNAQEMILVQEALQEKRIGDIAGKIADKKHVKFVLIAGPSSSGKTTFSHRLSIQLRAHGLRPHPVAVDNYFVNRDMTPKDAEGNYDFECLEAIDTKLLNLHLAQLLEGREVVLPTYNFKTGKREYNGETMRLGKNDVLVIEGIHCLNDALTHGLPKENKFKIYISALTQLNIDEHNRIPTTDGRLLRRIVRDARMRGTSAKETIAMWPSVRRGEERNIFPYQEDADVMFNSALIYELAVLKLYAEPALFGIPRNCAEYIEAKRLLKFLDYFVGVGDGHVPANSLLKEFTGGGCFRI